MSPASYLAAPPRDISLFQACFSLSAQNSFIIILKTFIFVNCFFAFFSKKYKKIIFFCKNRKSENFRSRFLRYSTLFSLFSTPVCAFTHGSFSSDSSFKRFTYAAYSASVIFGTLPWLLFSVLPIKIPPFGFLMSMPDFTFFYSSCKKA